MTPSMTLDATIRELEREALQGDQGAIRRLAALANRTAEVPPVEGIKINPRETGCSARAVRNWFLDVEVDGRSPIQTGPKGKDGGFSLRLLQRKEGGVVEVLTLRGGIERNEQLSLSLDGRVIYRSER